ncbi:MAG: MBOAT family protein [Anaerolineae bacterium]|jgi:D-alanyl-lipoteichoic acid acyltransferase DltB (MBOAT superfamily)|nr:MBOAT family protein [Anaerolineae bacterium]
MSPVSLEFGLFCAVVIALYYRVWPSHRWAVLLLAGWFFYATWHLFYVPLLIAISGLFYFCGRRIDEASTPIGARVALIGGVITSLAILVVFQYSHFFASAIVTDTFTRIIVPIGISFYTFQGIGYLGDVFRKVIPPERDPRYFMTFIAFFPILTSGPIERGAHLIPQLRAETRFDPVIAISALRLILWGVFKKLVIADRLAIYVNAVYDQPQAYSGAVLLIATLFYTVQIYADFSGYTDIARGVARLFGIDLFENFRQPYFAMSIRDFWTRWHISLSTWIRELMFMPLSRTLLRRSGGRYSRAIQAVSNLIVMTLVGLWHGPSWTFVIWGALHGVYMSVESLLNWRVKLVKISTPRQQIERVGRVILTLILVMIAWVFFRAKSLADAGYILTHWIAPSNGDLTQPFTGGLLPNGVEFALAIGLIGVLIISDLIGPTLLERFGRLGWVIRWAVYYGFGMAILFASLYGAGSAQFIYFQF